VAAPQAKPAKTRSKASPAYPQAAGRQKDPPQYAAQAAVDPPAFTPPEEEDSESTTTTVETSAACTALLASLAKADATLRCEIATALGKLGDKEAVLPLERHLGDQDIRVRRAVAGALVLLGHPKGNTLLDIAERTPAASMLMMAKPITRAKSYSGGSSIDSETLKKVGGAIVAIGVIGGGIWFWMNSTPSKSKKGKAAVKKVVKPPAPPVTYPNSD
jgi:nucleotide-binding universal stress UspA family protein